MTASITLLTKTGPNPHMSKRISLDEEGRLKTDGSECRMAIGTAIRTTAPSAADLARIIAGCGPDQAIALGRMRDDLPDTVPVVTAARLRSGAAGISRTRDFIDHRPGMEAWLLVDFDFKGMPAEVKARVETVGGTWNALLTVAPGLAVAERVVRASTSAGLSRSDTGEKFADSGGIHVYIHVKDGADSERFLKDLHDRCWLHGFGWHMIGGTGQLLERSLVDRTVGGGERLVFEGAPLVMPPLAQDRAKRMPEAFEGEELDTALVATPLTEFERRRVKEAKNASARALDKTAAKVRSQYDEVLAKKMAIELGMPLVLAQRLVKTRHRGVLLPFVDLEFDHLGTVSVGDVLAEPDRFVGETLADPLEGVGYGRCKAKVMRGDDGGLFIHSFAHGRTLYQLRHDARSAKAAIEQAPAGAVVDHAMAVLTMTDAEDDELSELLKGVAKAANVGIRDVKARFKKERREREQASRETAAAEADGRTVMPRPEADGELTPTVLFLDQTLSNDTREDPPMRDASGSLVDVKVQEPWNLHTLSTEGTNATGGEVMKAPAEPVLAPLSAVLVEMLIERYVAWRVVTKYTSYLAALPRPYIDALMQFPQSAIPVARAINTAPLVSMSGRIIEGVGLDRETGIFHRIDPHLRACLPANPPSEDDVKNALSFLMDEWLVDVALDPAGKCVAIMAALTIIERALLDARPAFLVTAGHRGGGKTTLVNMIVLATLGRKAAAASWSKDQEERKKALFSYLRQGGAVLVWDNIERGSLITCPHIEAALTSPETSDRVLGASRVDTVASTTIHFFTGNSITARGDMVSRSMMIILHVDRPDPENRKFEHRNPFTWTEENRPKIMRALYTLLVAGAASRSPGAEPETRFKSWWSLVGWPVEYAARLIGVSVSCAELLRAGEVEDDEATTVASALSALHVIFGDAGFTSRDVARVILEGIDRPLGPGEVHEISYRDDAEEAREQLADALRDLGDKLPTDRLSGHFVGKLFQKHLVDRPTWLEDGCTATLRRKAGHQRNTFHVQMTEGGDVRNSSFSSAATEPNNPHNPHADGISPAENRGKPRSSRPPKRAGKVGLRQNNPRGKADGGKPRSPKAPKRAGKVGPGKNNPRGKPSRVAGAKTLGKPRFPKVPASRGKKTLGKERKVSGRRRPKKM